jgi:hypothetical protein
VPLAKARAKPKVRKIVGYILIDLREDGIRLPDGTLIRREDVIGVIPDQRLIIYRKPDGTIEAVEIKVRKL